jgi:hypothetical protein
VATGLPDVADLPPVPMLLWPRGYTEGPCTAELGTIRVHRDGACCHCLGLALAEAHAGGVA